MRLRRKSHQDLKSQVSVVEEEEAETPPLAAKEVSQQPLSDSASSDGSCASAVHQKRYRSASTPTLCCCTSEPNRRCSQPITIRHHPVRSHLHALARALKRGVARKKAKSTSMVNKVHQQQQHQRLQHYKQKEQQEKEEEEERLTNPAFVISDDKNDCAKQ